MKIARRVYPNPIRKHPEIGAPNYYLYILDLHDSGHFYIGVTQNPETREAVHFNSIKNLLIRKKWHDYWQNCYRRKNKAEFEPDKFQAVHWFFAKKILPKVNQYVSPNKTIAHHYSFVIKHACYTFEEAKALESLYLQAAIGNRFCLNVQMKSFYSKRTKKCQK